MTFHREIDIGGKIVSSSLGAAIMPPFHVYTHVTDVQEDETADRTNENVPAPGTEAQDTQQEASATGPTPLPDK